MRCVIAIAGWLLACVPLTLAQEHYVSHWGSHTPPFSSWSTAATNIVDALAIASNGSTIWVTNGVYANGTTNNAGLLARVSVTRELTLRSVNGYRNTVIEGAFHSIPTNIGPNAVRALYMTDGVVDGFTLRRGATASSGSETQTAGGGVYADGGIMRNLRIAGNRGYTAGGAWLQTCSLSNAVLSANSSSTGPRVKINRNVQLREVSLNADGMMLPDIRILGTNATVITNSIVTTSVPQGTAFGRVHAITGSASHVFTITNLGVRPLLVDGVAPQGGNTGDWIIADWPENALAPGESAPLEFIFDPAGPGEKRSLFFIASNDPDDDPYALWLSGEGIQAEMLVLATNDFSTITNGSAYPLIAQGTDFGDVRVTGDPKSNSYIITNEGSAIMWVSQIETTELQASDFSVTAPTSFPYTVSIGGTSLTTVAFAPQALGYRATLLQLTSDAANSNYVFGIMGRGVEPQMAVLGEDDFWIPNGDSTPNLLDGTDFGTFAGAPITQTFSITNAGTYPLTLTGTSYVVIGGTDASDFSLGAQPTSPIAPGEAVTFDITFFPSVATTRTATVTLYSDDVYFTNSVYQFSIQADVDPDTRYADILADISPASASAVKWVDLNNDTLADLIIAGYDGTNRVMRIYENQGGGNLSLLATSIPGIDSARIAVGDIDNDGYVDIALSGMRNSGPMTAIYRNNGDLTFSDINGGFTAAYTGGLILGDIDNDGDLDLFASGYTLSSSVSTLYRNNGDLTFTATEDTFEPCRDGSATWIDYDSDGWIDLLITGSTTNSRLANLYHNHEGAFSLVPNDGITPISHGGIAKADFDADGKSDLLMTGYSDTGMLSDIYRFTASESALFSRQSFAFTPLWLSAVTAGDIDNNGWADALIAGEGAGGIRTTELAENSNGIFSMGDSPFPGMRTSSLSLGDYDADGDLDLALAGLATNGSVGKIYVNLNIASNTPPTAPTGLAAVLTNGNDVILIWTAASDSETAVNALTYNLYMGNAATPESFVSPHADITTGKRRIYEDGNMGHRTEWFLRNLTPGETYYWGVQAIDSAFAGSTFSTGMPITVPLIPDYVVSDIQVQRLPFSATVTVKNQGTDSGTAGTLSVWLDKPETADPGQASDATASIGELAAGSETNLVFETFTFPTNTVNNVFRAFINSDHAQLESYTENNQTTVNYTYTVYPEFWFRATALTNNVLLRWINPQDVGADSSMALINYATNVYPATTNDGAYLYQGTDQSYMHSGLIQDQPYFYSIWLTHDGTNWFEPEE